MALLQTLDVFVKQLACKVVGGGIIPQEGANVLIVRVPRGEVVPPIIITDPAMTTANDLCAEQQAIQAVLLSRYNAVAFQQKLGKNTYRRALSILKNVECKHNVKSRSKLVCMYSTEELGEIVEAYVESEKLLHALKKGISQCRRRATCLMNRHLRGVKKNNQ